VEKESKRARERREAKIAGTTRENLIVVIKC